MECSNNQTVQNTSDTTQKEVEEVVLARAAFTFRLRVGLLDLEAWPRLLGLLSRLLFCVARRLLLRSSLMDFFAEVLSVCAYLTKYLGQPV